MCTLQLRIGYDGGFGAMRIHKFIFTREYVHLGAPSNIAERLPP